MAHAEEIENLLDRLIIDNFRDSSAATIKCCKGSALKTISSTKAGRTNQFEVYSRLEGIVEKWRILNKDELADTLGDRTNELVKADWKWTPEVLSLLLLLSDRPTQQSGTKDLAIGEPEVEPAPVVGAEDDLDTSTDPDSELWKNVDFVQDGSDQDDDLESLSSEASDQRIRPISPSMEITGEALQDLIIEVPKADLTGLKDVYWRRHFNDHLSPESGVEYFDQDGPTLTELQAIREVIHMFLGLPTTIFEINNDGKIRLSKEPFMSHLAPSSMTKLFTDFVHIGSELSVLRHFVHQDSNIPLIQTLQAVLNQRLQGIDAFLNATQMHILDTRSVFVVSLLQFHEQANRTSRMIRLIIPILQHTSYSSALERPFSVLEGLYDTVCALQDIGDTEGYEHTADIFFQCFRTYLKPISLWMETGELDEHDNLMFIQRNDHDVSLDSVWQDQFSLFEDASGLLHAPTFLHIAAKKILNTGKSINFLKQIGSYDYFSPTRHYKSPFFSFDEVCRRGDPLLLSPFPALFDSIFDKWISSQYTSASSTLHHRLNTGSGLQCSLDALEYIFFFRAGILSSKVLYPVFEKLDGIKRCLTDSFTFTELFEDAFRSISQVDTVSLRIRIDHTNSQRSMSALEGISITYSLHWQIANIIRPENLTTYQRTFTLLAQAHRARFLLQRLKPAPELLQENRGCLRQIYSLRVRLLYFVNSMLNHISVMVLEVCTTRMRSSMAKAEDIDAMVAVHTGFVRIIEDQCLLTKKHVSIKQAVVALFDLVVLLSDSVARMDPKRKPIQHLPKKKHAGSGGDTSEDEDFPSSVDTADKNRQGGGHGDPDPCEVLEEKVGKMHVTFTQLYGFVAANVRVLSKVDNAACWEVLATILEAGEGS